MLRLGFSYAYCAKLTNELCRRCPNKLSYPHLPIDSFAVYWRGPSTRIRIEIVTGSKEQCLHFIQKNFLFIGCSLPYVRHHEKCIGGNQSDDAQRSQSDRAWIKEGSGPAEQRKQNAVQKAGTD